MAKITLETRQGVQEMETLGSERLLYSGLRQGFDLAHECASGTCGTCKAILVSGNVRSLWSDAPGNRYVKAERNEFLMCQCVADSNIHVKVRPALRAPVATPTPGKFSGVISAQQHLTDDVTTFEFKLSHPTCFLAGQFITLANAEIPGYRAYSMTNYSANETQVLNFLVKRIPGGKFTDWLFEEDRTGCSLEGFGPVGRAVFAPDIDQDFIALAGGSGIAGIMAILSHASSCGHFEKHRAEVVFGLNRPQDAFFLDRLNQYSVKHENLQITVALVASDSSGELQREYPNLEFAQGYLHEVADATLGDLSEVSVAFVAGPPVAVEACQKMLAMERKFSARKIRFDRFG